MKQKQLYTIILGATVLAGCSNFEKINTNPDKTDKVNSGMLATSMLLSVTRSTIASTKGFMQPYMLGKYITWGENQENFQFNRLNRASFERLAVLRNVSPMVAAALDDAQRNSYSGLAAFIRAWQFYQTTMQVGDIPYTDAIKGESDGVVQPKYDNQKTVFLGILRELDSANALLSRGSNFDGDPIFNGKVDNWRRVVNGFELHVLMQLYRKTADTDLKVIQRFQDIVNNRPLMRNYNDNFALAYNNTQGQNYPWSDVPAGSGNSFVKSNYTMLTSTFLDPLKALGDRRLFYFAKPSPVQIAAGKLPSEWDAYPGAEPSDPFPVLQDKRVSKDYADLNNRYVQLVNAEPVSVFGYWDQQFVLAEAALRGWIANSPAQTYYAAGIGEAMRFTADYTPDNVDYHHNMKIDAGYIQNYITTNALTGSTAQQLQQIITQKYIAGFLQGANYNAWFENRRTGYPVFKLNANSNLNTPSTAFPVRWLYPSNELTYNNTNMDDAVKRQFPGGDNTNGVMWILKD
ncbi:SusD/RagB family nutrient-binding outer membrane lipoprotein [Chitinophaga caseinilytica]|uniref:SusD/RagB family nutrient-binding outer membrane lipoprotein n=1 Tax=Chitinophaga caseinilytica TaxID=2267521 RepID=UPI003C2BC216